MTCIRRRSIHPRSWEKSVPGRGDVGVGEGLERELAWSVVQTDQRKVSVCKEKVEGDEVGIQAQSLVGGEVGKGHSQSSRSPQ